MKLGSLGRVSKVLAAFSVLFNYANSFGNVVASSLASLSVHYNFLLNYVERKGAELHAPNIGVIGV